MAGGPDVQALPHLPQVVGALNQQRTRAGRGQGPARQPRPRPFKTPKTANSSIRLKPLSVEHISWVFIEINQLNISGFIGCASVIFVILCTELTRVDHGASTGFWRWGSRKRDDWWIGGLVETNDLQHEEFHRSLRAICSIAVRRKDRKRFTFIA